MKVFITTEIVEESIIELYVFTRQEIVDILEFSRQLCPNFTMVADFWPCKMRSEKYLGVRVYFIDSNQQLKSVLMGGYTQI